MIESGLSPESIFLYLDMIAEGSKALTSSNAYSAKDKKVLSELNEICFYGFVNKNKQKKI